MAEPGSRTGTTAAPQHDWEFLSMSMSASAFGSASLVCGCAACTGRDSGVPHQVPSGDENLFFKPPRLDKDFSSGLPYEDWAESFSGGGSSNRVTVAGTSHSEPFTEGWKPHLGPAVIRTADHSSFDYVSGYDPFWGQYQEGACSTNEDTEPLVSLSRETFMVGEDVVVTEGTAGDKSLSGSSTTDAEKIPVTKSRKVQVNGSLRAQSRESTAMWSIALAATVVGIVIIGYRWHRERLQNQHLRMELSDKEEKLNDLVYQVGRLRHAITGRGRVSLMRS